MRARVALSGSPLIRSSNDNTNDARIITHIVIQEVHSLTHSLTHSSSSPEIKTSTATARHCYQPPPIIIQQPNIFTINIITIWAQVFLYYITSATEPLAIKIPMFGSTYLVSHLSADSLNRIDLPLLTSVLELFPNFHTSEEAHLFQFLFDHGHRSIVEAILGYLDKDTRLCGTLGNPVASLPDEVRLLQQKLFAILVQQSYHFFVPPLSPGCRLKLFIFLYFWRFQDGPELNEPSLVTCFHPKWQWPKEGIVTHVLATSWRPPQGHEVRRCRLSYTETGLRINLHLP